MLKKNYLEFGNTIKQQIFGTASGTKFFPLWARIFMNDLETKFLEGQHLQPYSMMMIFFSSAPMVKRVLRNF